ncbi:hypothetical protein D3C83_57170 [compost metagenome]
MPDVHNIKFVAERLLRGPEGAVAGRREHLLGAAIVGRLARGEREQAAVLWKEFADRTISQAPNLMPRLLEAHLSARTGN